MGLGSLAPDVCLPQLGIPAHQLQILALRRRSLPPPAKIHAPWPHSSVRVAAGRDRPAWSVQGQTCAAMSGQRWKHEARRADLGA